MTNKIYQDAKDKNVAGIIVELDETGVIREPGTKRGLTDQEIIDAFFKGVFVRMLDDTGAYVKPYALRQKKDSGVATMSSPPEVIQTVEYLFEESRYETSQTPIVFYVEIPDTVQESNVIDNEGGTGVSNPWDTLYEDMELSVAVTGKKLKEAYLTGKLQIHVVNADTLDSGLYPPLRMIEHGISAFADPLIYINYKGKEEMLAGVKGT